MPRSFISTLALAFILTLAQPAAAQDASSSIVGVWKLTSFVRKEVGTDKSVQVFGERPAGYRVHTAGDRAFYMFFAENRKAPGASPTDADRAELFRTMTAAGGSYKVDGNKVTFQPDVSSTASTAALTYRFEIAGRTLTMTTDAVKNPATGVENTLISTYERLE